MQVFTPARPVYIKSEFKSDPDRPLDEEIKTEIHSNISWKFLYAHPPSLIDWMTLGKDNQSALKKSEISHDDVHQLVYSRVKVLQFVHRLLGSEKKIKNGDDRWASSGVSQDEEIVMYWKSEVSISGSEARDSLSFYLCALGMSSSPNSWEWFCLTESALFRARLLALRQTDRDALYRELKIASSSIDPRKELTLRGNSQDVINLCRALLMMENRFSSKNPRISSSPSIEKVHVNTQTYQVESNPESFWYKTDLASAQDPIRRRDVLLYKGFPYVQSSHLQSILIKRFGKRIESLHERAVEQRINLSESHWSYFLRIIETLCNIEEIHTTDQARVSQCIDAVRPSDLDFLSDNHFPPCMQQLHAQLVRDRHLKYHGRWQYGLFLKQIGLSMEDAIDFFGGKESMGIESFRRSRYGYSIRHYYGREGKHANYSSMGCSAIIMGAPPTPSSCHGCPFKHEETKNLKSMIKQQNPEAKNVDIEDIIEAREGQHYSRACFHAFKLNRPHYCGDSLFSSPYEYFMASASLVKEEKSKS